MNVHFRRWGSSPPPRGLLQHPLPSSERHREHKKPGSESPSSDPQANFWTQCFSIMGLTVEKHFSPTHVFAGRQTMLHLRHRQSELASLVYTRNYETGELRQLSLSVIPRHNPYWRLKLERASQSSVWGPDARRRTTLKLELSRPSIRQRASDQRTCSPTSSPTSER